MQAEKLINTTFSYALVGASNKPEKYGYKIFQFLIKAGFKTVPINLQEKEILSITAYPTLTAAMHKLPIDIVIFVLPPEKGEALLPEVKVLGVKKLWLQPGAESPNIINYCAKNKITCIQHHCIMKEIMLNLQQ